MATTWLGAGRIERWRIVPLETPRVSRRCSRCDGLRRFRSSGRFRVNAQKRRLDVWLVHRCETCDETWNAPVLERVAARDVARGTLDAFLCNDPDTAWRLAFAVRGASLEDSLDCRVERACEEAGARPGADRILLLELAAPIAVRLDRLLSRELDVPRAQLARWHASGALRLEPEPRTGLRARVRDRQRVVLASQPPGDAAVPLC